MEIPEDPDLGAGRGTLLIVADGVGGHGGGAVASAEAAHTVVREHYLYRRGDPGRALRRALKRASLHVYTTRLGHPELAACRPRSRRLPSPTDGTGSATWATRRPGC